MHGIHGIKTYLLYIHIWQQQTAVRIIIPSVGIEVPFHSRNFFARMCFFSEVVISRYLLKAVMHDVYIYIFIIYILNLQY
jgi:hypothetical protein